MYHTCLFGKFPINNLKFTKNVNTLEHPGFYYVKLEFIHTFPVLPIKTDKLIFPEGEVEGLF
jgi:hypothetical protein